MNVRPISDVSSTHKARNAKPGCQKYRLSPVVFNTFEIPSAQTKPATTVKKNGGK